MIELDPSCGAAYGYAAAMHILLRTQGWTGHSEDAFRECIRLTNDAIDHGGDDAEALSLAALTRVCLGYQVEASAEIAERSLLLNVNSPWGWYASGLAKIALGDFDSAVDRIARSLRLNPKDPAGYVYLNSYALAHFFRKDYVEAIKQADKSQAINSKFLPAIRIKAASYAMLDRPKDARMAIEALKAIAPHVTNAIVAQTMIPLRPQDMSFYAEALRIAGMA